MTALALRSDAQKAIFDNALKGQLSDGWFENTETDTVLWTIKTSVIPFSVGTSAKLKHPVNFTELLEAPFICDRMVQIGQSVDPSYDYGRLIDDLNDITNIVYGGKK